MKTVPLDTIFWFQEGPGVRNYQYTQSGVKLLNVTNLVDGQLVISNTDKYISEEEAYGKYKHFLCDEGDLIIASSGITEESVTKKNGFVHKEDLPLCMNTSTIRFKPTAQVGSKYLYYFFRSNNFRRQIAKLMSGVAQLNFGPSHLHKVHVGINEKDIENKIVAELDSISELIVQKKNEISLLDEQVKSLFNEMFSTVSDFIPIGSVCKVTSGFAFKSSDISGSGIKLLQIGNVALNDVTWEGTNYLPAEFEEKFKNWLLAENDIVVALTRPIIRSLQNVKACVIKTDDLPCLLNQRVARIRPIDANKTTVGFVFSCLMTQLFTEYVERCCTGSSQPNISTKDLENYLIPNVDEKIQQLFIKRKQQIDKLRFNYQRQIEVLQGLLNKKMEEYFGGEES